MITDQLKRRQWKPITIFTFPIISSWERQSNTFESSVESTSKILPWSTDFFHFSNHYTIAPYIFLTNLLILHIKYFYWKITHFSWFLVKFWFFYQKLPLGWTIDCDFGITVFAFAQVSSNRWKCISIEAVAHRCSVKKVFLEIS